MSQKHLIRPRLPVAWVARGSNDTLNALRLPGADNILRSEQGLYRHLADADCVLTRDLDVPAAAGPSTLIR